jgi:serine/threonine protein kinase/tetratricopeptide (TPR) repeat protein
MAIADNASSPAEPTQLLERGQNIGRFVVLGLVGRGGMGEVYAAYDPELERKVAVKLLRTRRSQGSDATDGRTRLLREAQAIARLSHPNVVVVYDVGTVADSVFIAMEFLEGTTAGGWLHSGVRSWRDILAVFLAAGRGLSAAHEAGLMHRDFKPENVMVAKDGQVRVMDFGLARQVIAANDVTISTEEAAARSAEALQSLISDADMDSTVKLGRASRPGDTGPAAVTGGAFLRAKLTQTGATLGTPAYMAPEQFSGGRTDARTDQFSFCVALYEALYGDRPFVGDNLAALRTSVLVGDVHPPPSQTRVPVWIRRVLLRGLRTDPEQRFPSMAALLAALQNDPAVRRRKWLTAGAAAAAMVAVALGVHRLGGNQRTMCAGASERLAGIWEPAGAASARKDAIRLAFARSGRSYAQQAFTGIGRLLDDYAARWTGMYREACEATHLRGEQSAEVLDLRMACLQDRLGNLRALSDLFTSADGAVVENAVVAAGALPALDRCADVALLKAVVKPPGDPAKHRRVDQLRDETARLVALRDAGRCTAARAQADQLIDQVRKTGYLPLLADALDAVAGLGNDCVDPHIAIQQYKEAFAAALESHHDQQVARAAIVIADMAQNRMNAHDEARDWLTIGVAALRRIGHDLVLEGLQAGSEGLVLSAEGKNDQAIAAMRRSLALKSKNYGPAHPETVAAVGNLGVALQDAGRFAEALEAHRRARTDWERLVGRDHPRISIFSNNEGETLNKLHRYGEARAAFQRAIDNWRRADSDPFLIAYPLTGLGIAWLEEGNGATAIPPLEEAYQIRTEKKADPVLHGEVAFALARALWQRPTAQARARGLAGPARAPPLNKKHSENLLGVN